MGSAIAGRLHAAGLHRCRQRRRHRAERPAEMTIRCARSVASCALAIVLLLASTCVSLRAEPVAAKEPSIVTERIIVSGASGQLGRLVVKDLLARGVPAKSLILVSRTPEALQEYAK